MVLSKTSALFILSLFGVCHCYHVTRMPPVANKEGSTIQGPEQAKDAIYWQHWGGKIPKDAFLAGYTKNENDLEVPIYLGHGPVNGYSEKMTLPVQIFDGSTFVEATYGREVTRIQKSDENVEVLCIRNQKQLAWVPYEKLKGDTVDTDCVVAGNELNDIKVYFGRTIYAGVSKVGKVHFRNHAIYFPESNKEKFVDRQFEILCYKQPLVDKKILEAEEQVVPGKETPEKERDSDKRLLPSKEILIPAVKKEEEVYEEVKIETPGTTLSLRKSEGINIFNWNFYGTPFVSNKDRSSHENEKSSADSASVIPKLYWREYHGAPVPEDAILAGTTHRDGKTVKTYIGQAYIPIDNAGIQSVAIYEDSDKVANTYIRYTETTKNIKILCTNVKPEDFDKFLAWIPAKDAMKYSAEEDFVITGTEVNRANGEQVYLFSGRGNYKDEFGFVVGKVVTGGSHWRFYFPYNRNEYLKIEDFEILAYKKALDKFSKEQSPQP